MTSSSVNGLAEVKNSGACGGAGNCRKRRVMERTGQALSSAAAIVNVMPLLNGSVLLDGSVSSRWSFWSVTCPRVG